MTKHIKTYWQCPFIHRQKSYFSFLLIFRYYAFLTLSSTFLLLHRKDFSHMSTVFLSLDQVYFDDTVGGAVGAKLSGQARPSASSPRSTLSRWGGSDLPFLIKSENFTVVF